MASKEKIKTILFDMMVHHCTEFNPVLTPKQYGVYVRHLHLLIEKLGEEE